MLWNAGRTIADYLEKEASLFQGKYVLEFGAAAALPSLVCALKGAAKVVATDYPDTVLIENITYNIQNSTPNLDASKIVAEVCHLYQHHTGLSLMFIAGVSMGFFYGPPDGSLTWR
jgi:predicted nicotinamide N-methyase